MPLYIKWNIDPELFSLGGCSLWYYSLLFALAFTIGYWIMLSIYKKENVPEETLSSLLFYILVGTVLGARLGHTLFYEFSYYKDHPLEIVLPFRISDQGFQFTGYAGLASHGGAVGILIAVALFSKKFKQPFFWLLDRLAITVALAGFFIRTGNLFNSEIIGTPTTLPWAFIFERIDLIPRHPAQLYEAILYLLIFLFLWWYHKKQNTHYRNGLLLGYFLMLVFSARFVVEFIKEDQEAFEKGWIINMGQILSIPFILVGVYLILSRLKPDTNNASYFKNLQ